jgi:hypothetical protein
MIPEQSRIYSNFSSINRIFLENSMYQIINLGVLKFATIFVFGKDT